MPPRSLRLARAACTLLASAAVVSTGAIAPAAADPVTGLKSGGASYAVYLVKDLGGGAYYNLTTGSLYAVDAASAALVTAATTGAELLASSADSGRTLLLLVNGAVLVPVQKALS